MATRSSAVTSQIVSDGEYAARSLGYVYNSSTLAYEVATPSTGGGGGGAATIADGADVAEGTKADAAWDGLAASASLISIGKFSGVKLEAIRALLAGTIAISAAALPLPAGAATGTKQDAGNTSLASIDTKTPALVAGRVPVDGSGVTQPISAVALPLPAGAAQDGTDIGAPFAMPAGGVGIRGWLSAIWTKLNGSLVVTQATPANLQVTATVANLDVALSTRLKPADTLAGVTTVAAVTAITNALPAGTNKLGTVDIATAPATAKGTQGANGVPTQDLKDSGRVRFAAATVIAGVAGVAAEALLSMVPQRDAAPGGAATTFAVTAGKRLRLSSITVGIVSTAAAVVSVRVVLRCNPGGAAAVASPIEIIIAIPSGAALAQAGGFITVPLPDGFEYSGTHQFALTHVGSVATYTLWAALGGYEY